MKVEKFGEDYIYHNDKDYEKYKNKIKRGYWYNKNYAILMLGNIESDLGGLIIAFYHHTDEKGENIYKCETNDGEYIFIKKDEILNNSYVDMRDFEDLDYEIILKQNNEEYEIYEDSMSGDFVDEYFMKILSEKIDVEEIQIIHFRYKLNEIEKEEWQDEYYEKKYHIVFLKEN